MEQLLEHQKEFRYFVRPGEFINTRYTSADRLRVAIITSIRDLAIEGVGKENPSFLGDEMRLKGTLEHAIVESTRGKLARIMDIVLIVTDDIPKDLEKISSPLPVRPERDKPWVHPINLRLRDGSLASEITKNIPSNHRYISMKNQEERMTAKKKFEDRIRSAMAAVDADVLVSDHLLIRLQHLVGGEYGDLQNRILNTHPGITDKRHKYRSPGNKSYDMAIERAQGRRGTTHDKTGASFHIIDDDRNSVEMDGGPVLMDAERTPVLTTDLWADLCSRNYKFSKNIVFEQGMLHYAHNIFPHLGSIDVRSLEPIETDVPVYGDAAA